MPVADRAAVPAAPEAEVAAAAAATATTRGRPAVRAATVPERAPSRPPIRGAPRSRKTRLSDQHRRALTYEGRDPYQGEHQPLPTCRPRSAYRRRSRTR